MTLATPGPWPYLAPILLLVCSNLFMTIAWYGHSQVQGGAARHRHLGELGHRLRRYCFAVPANRIGSAVYSPAELKTLQEVITLLVFALFTWLYFDQPLSWVQGAGFALIALGAVLVFKGNP